MDNRRKAAQIPRMTLADFDRWLAHNLPTSLLKDFYPRAMRRLTEYGMISGEYVRETKHGFRMNVDRLDALNWYLHYYGEWEPQISAAFKALITPGDTVIDIGGNVGYSALLAAALTGPDGRVLSAEPCTETLRHFTANLELNPHLSVELLKAAIGSEPGQAELYTWGSNELGQASLVRHECAVASEKVDVVSFRELLDRVDPATISVIKVDVEGVEDDVVQAIAAVSHLLSRRCTIFIEVNRAFEATDLLAPLLSLGFEARRIGNQYTPRFYLEGSAPQLEPVAIGRGHLQDTILSRAPDVFARLALLN